MKVEVSAQINEQGQLLLVDPLPQPLNGSTQVKVTVEYLDDEEYGTEEPYDTPIEEVKAGLLRALQEVRTGKTIPIEKLWEELEKDDD